MSKRKKSRFKLPSYSAIEEEMGRPPELPSFDDLESPSSTTDLTPDAIRNIQERLGNKSSDWKLARRVYNESVTRLTHATVPEIITYLWLEDNGHSFVFQAQAFGGRSAAGGIIPDFVVSVGGYGVVWQVQGEYYHTRFKTREEDQAQAYALKGLVIEGMEVRQVVELWEGDIYKRRPEVFEYGLNGIGLRQ